MVREEGRKKKTSISLFVPSPPFLLLFSGSSITFLWWQEKRNTKKKFFSFVLSLVFKRSKEQNVEDESKRKSENPLWCLITRRITTSGCIPTSYEFFPFSSFFSQNELLITIWERERDREREIEREREREWTSRREKESWRDLLLRK